MSDDLRAAAEAVAVRALVHDTSWHGLNDEADWSKGYWTHPGKAAVVMLDLTADPAFLAWAVREACYSLWATDANDTTVLAWLPKPDVAAVLEGTGEE